MRAARRRSGSRASGRRSPTARTSWRQLLAAPGIEFASLDGKDTADAVARDPRRRAAASRAHAVARSRSRPRRRASWSSGRPSLTSERLFDWAGGLIWLAPKDIWARDAATIREALAGRGGHATLMRAPTWLRREVDAVRAAAGAVAGADRAGQAQLRPEGRAQPRADVRRDLTCNPGLVRALSGQRAAPRPQENKLAHASPLPRPLVPVQPQDPHRPAREVAGGRDGRGAALGPSRRAAAAQPGLRGAGADRRRAHRLRQPGDHRPSRGGLSRDAAAGPRARHSATRPGGWSPGSTPSSTARSPSSCGASGWSSAGPSAASRARR